MMYTEQDKLDIFKIFLQNGLNKYRSRRQYRRLYPERPTPSLNTFKNVYQKMQNTYSLQRKKRIHRPNEEEEMEMLLYLEGSPVKTTQTVKPHTVNGTVLHRPTISLTRLGITENAILPNTSNFQNNANSSLNIVNRSSTINENSTIITGESSGISPNRRIHNGITENGHFFNGIDEESCQEGEEEQEGDLEGDDDSFISRRTSKTKSRPLPEDSSEEENENEEQEEDDVEGQSPNEPELRLSTICEKNEGDEDSFISRRTSKTKSRPLPEDSSEEENENEEQEEDDVEGQSQNEPELHLSTICEENEITIILPRLSEAEMATALSSQIVRRSFNDSSCSTEPQANETYFNMTVNDESLRASKRLRVDVTVFEPRGNSTTFDATLVNATPSPRPSPLRRGTYVSEMSRLEITPTNESPIPDDQITWMMNTPSTSAMGDLNRTETSKLAILGGLGLCPTPTKEMLANEESVESPSSTRTSTPRTRSSRITNRKNIVSPHLKRMSHISKKRTVSIENPIKSPIIVLERLEKLNAGMSTQMKAHVLGSILNTTVAKKSSEIKSLQKRGRPTKSSSRIRSQSESSHEEENKNSNRGSRKTSKAENNYEGNENRESNVSLKHKIKEVQRRLSSYNTTDTSEPAIQVSPSKRGRRPTRAAKPKDLKDASLKAKMRRT